MKFQLLFFLMALTGTIYGQLQSPDQFLPHPWGSHFTPHHILPNYFNHVADNSSRVQLIQYGHTNEGRPLIMAFVSSPENLAVLDEIRQNNLRRAGVLPGETDVNLDRAIVWISCSVHGNEAAGTESAYQLLYELANPANERTQDWLKNTIVVLDPSLNPDGYARYTNWYRRAAGHIPDYDPEAREHNEPWPRGRTNHYYFDLNRDWAWQTQVESRQRMRVINSWLPHVHADLHEQGVNSPYYFAPAAQPYHPYVTSWQRHFQVEIGKNHAKYFDANGWLYFTKEVFDLLYPSYGDTYPTFNGAIGMTYEQGGSGRAGRGITMNNGDTLTLRDRVDHHLAASLSTIEVSSNNADRLIENFGDFWDKSRNDPPGKYRSFIVPATNPPAKIRAFCDVLEKNGIEYGSRPRGLTAEVYDYVDGQTKEIQIQASDLIISTNQPKGLLVQVLLEPSPELVDSNTYDITAWSLPYAYGLQTYASTLKVEVTEEYSFIPNPPFPENKPYAYLIKWRSFQSAQLLAKLLQNDIKVRFAKKEFKIDGKVYPAGTLVVNRADNRKNLHFHQKVKEVASGFEEEVSSVETGFVETGPDFGSSAYQFIEVPKVAIIGGESTYSNSFGELWYFLDQDLKYPATIYEEDNLAELPFESFNTLILTDGRYQVDSTAMSVLREWIEAGGHLILIGVANRTFAGRSRFDLRRRRPENEGATSSKEAKMKLEPYGDARRRRLMDNIPGAIIRNQMDNTHPLGFGLPRYYYSLKTSSLHFPYLRNAWNVGVIGEEVVHEGFIGSKIKKKLRNTTTVAGQDMGDGHITYLVDNPLFRAFWYNGKLLVGNALFLAGQ